ncbi:hypothetical protein SNEBB_000647 [Seison nebaliae]|nr:hypothetical protein SNEBB_000647 [Seison nebaliae]
MINLVNFSSVEIKEEFLAKFVRCFGIDSETEQYLLYIVRECLDIVPKHLKLVSSVKTGELFYQNQENGNIYSDHPYSDILRKIIVLEREKYEDEPHCYQKIDVRETLQEYITDTEPFTTEPGSDQIIDDFPLYVNDNNSYDIAINALHQELNDINDKFVMHHYDISKKYEHICKDAITEMYLVAMKTKENIRSLLIQSFERSRSSEDPLEKNNRQDNNTNGSLIILQEKLEKSEKLVTALRINEVHLKAKIDEMNIEQKKLSSKIEEQNEKIKMLKSKNYYIKAKSMRLGKPDVDTVVLNADKSTFHDNEEEEAIQDDTKSLTIRELKESSSSTTTCVEMNSSSPVDRALKSLADDLSDMDMEFVGKEYDKILKKKKTRNVTKEEKQRKILKSVHEFIEENRSFRTKHFDSSKYSGVKLNCARSRKYENRSPVRMNVVEEFAQFSNCLLNRPNKMETKMKFINNLKEIPQLGNLTPKLSEQFRKEKNEIEFVELGRRDVPLNHNQNCRNDIANTSTRETIVIPSFHHSYSDDNLKKMKELMLDRFIECREDLESMDEKRSKSTISMVNNDWSIKPSKKEDMIRRTKSQCERKKSPMKRFFNFILKKKKSKSKESLPPRKHSFLLNKRKTYFPSPEKNMNPLEYVEDHSITMSNNSVDFLP